MKYDNLKSKTIFDFTTDTEIIEEITLMSKAEYIEEVKKFPQNNCLDLLELAERTDNKELEKAVKEQYKDYFNDNVIID